jgi:hypothetical protein
MITFNDVNSDEIKLIIAQEIYDSEILETNKRIAEKRRLLFNEKKLFIKKIISNQIKSIEHINFNNIPKCNKIIDNTKINKKIKEHIHSNIDSNIESNTSNASVNSNLKDYDIFKNFLQNNYKHIKEYKKSQILNDLKIHLGRSFKIQQWSWSKSNTDSKKSFLIEDCDIKKHGWYKNPFFSNF